MAIVIIFFLASFGVILLCVWLALSYFSSKQKQQIRSMLRKAESAAVEPRDTQLLMPEKREDGLSKLLKRFHIVEKLDLLIEQAGQRTKGSKLILFSCLAAGAGALLGSKFPLLPKQVSMAACGALGGALPLLVILRKRAKNIAAFEKQFPEALDFLSRSMRAGHGFSIALEMLATDSADPLGSAFRHVSNDMQLGSSLDVALGKLLVLVPLVDVRFFVSSVLLQQETGGNLGEVLSKLATIIRERFRLKGQVRAASAHGRITGLVLVLMPATVAVIMMVTSPQYLIGLAANHIGRVMIYAAIGGQIVGYFVIRAITNIKV